MDMNVNEHCKVFTTGDRVVIAWRTNGMEHFVSVNPDSDFVRIHNGEEHILVQFDEQNIPQLKRSSE
jgi:hypothetical protein